MRLFFPRMHLLERCLEFSGYKTKCYVSSVVFYSIDFSDLLPFVYYQTQRRNPDDDKQKQMAKVAILV